MKTLKLFVIATLCLIAGLACIAGMTVTLDEFSKPSLTWYKGTLLILGLCFLMYILQAVLHLLYKHIKKQI